MKTTKKKEKLIQLPVRLRPDLYKKLEKKAFELKKIDRQASMSKVTNIALDEYFNK